MKNTIIEEYKTKNYDIIYNIWESSVAATHNFLTKEDFEFYKFKVPTLLSQVTLYVAKSNQQILGFLGTSDHINIDLLFVSPQHIRTGVGSRLMQYALNILKLKQVDVNEQNIAAYNFYKSFGFKLDSRNSIDGYGKPYPVLHLSI